MPLVEYDKVLKYSSPEYGFIVFHAVDGDEFNAEFWTLEKTEEDAKRRVENEVEAYGYADNWRFFYRTIRRVEEVDHRGKPYIDVRVIR